MTFLSCKTNDPGAGSNDFPDIPLAYDSVAQDSVKDDYFGNEVPDPYRWLEDDNSSETKDWVSAQNKLTFDYLGHIPFRQALKTRITDLMNYEKQGAPFKEANSYFSLETMVCKIRMSFLGSLLPMKPQNWFWTQIFLAKKVQVPSAESPSQKMVVFWPFNYRMQAQIGIKFS